jgi:hypothetical protein
MVLTSSRSGVVSPLPLPVYHVTRTYEADDNALEPWTVSALTDIGAELRKRSSACQAGHQGHDVGLPAVAGLPHGHQALAETTRSDDQRDRRFRLRRREALTVILIRDKSRSGLDLALVTTEKEPGIARVIERYATRWAIEPATADMTAKLRRVIIAAKFKQPGSHQPEPSEIHAIRLAWGDALDLAA